MRTLMFALTTALALNASAIEWGLKVIRTIDGHDNVEYWFTDKPEYAQFTAPSDWACLVKVDEPRTQTSEESGVVINFQNGFLSCRSPDGVIINTSSGYVNTKYFSREREANLIIKSDSLDLTAILIPCKGSQLATCKAWKKAYRQATY